MTCHELRADRRQHRSAQSMAVWIGDTHGAARRVSGTLRTLVQRSRPSRLIAHFAVGSRWPAQTVAVPTNEVAESRGQ